MILYSYYRSSASFRVRAALALKGLAYEYAAVHLGEGEQFQEPFAALSTDGLVPLLDINGLRLHESMAIIEYLDETYPQTPLLPSDALGRARVRALSQTVACEIHPLNNLRVLRYLKGQMGAPQEAIDTWYRHWVRSGLEAFERSLQALPDARFCWGSQPTMADCMLVPQIFNARRFNTPLDGLPRTMAVFDACMELTAFQAAQPSACPDFVA
jgi:maleylacetoacetate isomerase/maleylpyruvate isomerase